MEGINTFYISAVVGGAIAVFMISYCARELVRCVNAEPPTTHTPAPISVVHVAPLPPPPPPPIVLEHIHINAEECPICFEEGGDTKRMLRIALCGHTFCEPCLTTWLAINRVCPLCNLKV